MGFDSALAGDQAVQKMTVRFMAGDQTASGVQEVRSLVRSLPAWRPP